MQSKGQLAASDNLSVIFLLPVI